MVSIGGVGIASHRYRVYMSKGKWYWRLYGGTRIIGDGSQGYAHLRNILDQVMKIRGANSDHQVWIHSANKGERYA